MKRKVLGKIRYLGPDIVVTFTNEKIYEVLEIDKLTGLLRIIDNSDDDYLYSPIEPGLPSEEYKGGRFEIVEDDEKGSLSKVIYGKAPEKSKRNDVNIAVAGK
ncbi:MAG: hypothetical protein FWD71_12340 [Oscillospiraceae bacterium]|nr:hypothetical protein [Oscillospiraceae bacterium]